jgi:hypothetical protein
VAAYVPSRVGERFSIAVENHSLNDATCIFYVDGQMASVLMCHAKPKYYMVNCQGVQPQPGILRRFVFSRATLTGTSSRFIDEDEPVETSDKGSSQVGVIRVVIRRCVVLTYDATATYLQFNSASAIHEKSQKGMLDTKTEYSLVESSNVDWETKNNTKPDPMQTYSISITVSHGPSFRLLINRWVHLEMTLILDLLAAMGVAPKIQSGESTFGPKRARPETSEEDSILQENKRLKVLSFILI